MKKQIKILIADDHTMFRESLKQVINSRKEFIVIGEASDGNEVVELTKELHPDVVIMDINMPGKSGIDAAKEIKHKWKEIKIIILTMLESELYIMDALKSEIEGYLYKDAQISELFLAINKVNSGERYIPDELKEKVIDYISGQSFKDIRVQEFEKPMLTPRQIEIIKYAAQGFTSKEIAEKLFLSELTIIKHRKNIIKKLGLRNFTEVVSFAFQKGIIK